MEEVIDGLPAEGHYFGDLFGVGVEVITKVDDFLLAAGKTRQYLGHLTGKLPEMFFCNDPVLHGGSAAE